MSRVSDAAPTSSPAERNRFGIWLWLTSDTALFASLIATYLTLRGALWGGPGPQQLFDLRTTAVATFVLLASSLAVGLAIETHREGRTGAVRGWLIVTALLGLAFVGMQAAEFHKYTLAGLTFARSNFASSFYTLVGFHGLHVSFGVLWLGSLLVYAWRRRGGIPPEEAWRLEAAGLYWYFVDVVWVVIFTVVYLNGKVG